MEEGLAVRAQLNFRPGSEYHKKWDCYMHNIAKHSTSLAKSVQTGSWTRKRKRKVMTLKANYLDNFGPASAIGFAIISLAEKKWNLSQIVDHVREEPDKLWNSYIGLVPGFKWNPFSFGW